LPAREKDLIRGTAPLSQALLATAQGRSE